jgi:hypothetical protein
MSQYHSTVWSPLVLMVIGLALMVLGWTWSWLVPSSVYWGPEEAQEYVQAQADLHAKTHAAKHRKDGTDDSEFAAARERFEKVRDQLEKARGMRGSTGTYLAAAGILLVLVGIGIYLTNKQSE